MRYAVKAKQCYIQIFLKKNRQVIAAEGEQKASKALREASMVILRHTLEFIIIVFIIAIFIVIVVIFIVIIIVIITVVIIAIIAVIIIFIITSFSQ